jgi:tyrosine-protein phosphatase 2/3
MLTAETEGNQLKCHPYWQGREFGPLKLKALSEKKVSLDIDKQRSNPSATSSSASSESGRRRAATTTTTTPQPPPSQSETPYVIIRKFSLSHAAHPFAPIREITHLHLPSWPDFGAPAQPSHLLALVELANVMQRAALPVNANLIAASVASQTPAAMGWLEDPEHDPNSRPMLVHCSAGCGRTGAFCTVDSVIDMLKRQRKAYLKQDGEGDITMEEVLSPKTAAKSQPPVSHYDNDSGNLRPSLFRQSSIDATWLDNESLDLIEKTVEHFRGQRLSMVQSLRQFVLCYETVLEWVWRQHNSNNNPTGSSKSRPRSEIWEAKARR